VSKVGALTTKAALQPVRHATLFPKPVRPVFQGRVQKKISFSVRKWQKIFVPHMQTAFLERLKKKAPPWTDLPLIEKELAARR